MGENINRALHGLLQSDPRYVFLGEDVLAGRDGCLQLHRPKMGRRGEQHDVAGFDDFLVGVEAHEFM